MKFVDDQQSNTLVWLKGINMGSAQSIGGNNSTNRPFLPSNSHIYELEEDIKWKDEIQSGVDLHDTLPEDATGEDVVWRLRGSNREPWKDITPPKEDNMNPDLYETDNATSDSLSTSTSIIHQKHLQIMQYMTHWDERNKGWSLILEEKGQPLKPITGGFSGAMKNTRFDKWNRMDSKPLIARCPGGTSNPVRYVVNHLLEPFNTPQGLCFSLMIKLSEKVIHSFYSSNHHVFLYINRVDGFAVFTVCLVVVAIIGRFNMCIHPTYQANRWRGPS